MKLNATQKSLPGVFCAVALAWPLFGWPEAQPAAAAESSTVAVAQEQAEIQSMLEEAERARAEAERARQEAVRVAERARQAARRQTTERRELANLERAMDEREREERNAERERMREAERAEMERAREELSRAHRELREATREIARAHREVARSAAEAASGQVGSHEINLGDRAVLGVVLGSETSEGVELIGVSPDGPADRAGLQSGDLMISIRGESLASEAAGPSRAREKLYDVMEEVEPGETLSIEVRRDGETWAFDVTAERREPSSWQTLIRIPEPPAAPAAPGAPAAPSIVVERIAVPHADLKELDAQMHALGEELKLHKFVIVGPDGERIEWDGNQDSDFALPEDFEFEVEGFSDLATAALADADVWFGLPQALGLELATMNEGLGSYFMTERGVLIIQARHDNAYELQSGDVVLNIDDRVVNSPTDLMRALREAEPGKEVAIGIKRDHKDVTLKVIMPENRLGWVMPEAMHHP